MFEYKMILKKFYCKCKDHSFTKRLRQLCILIKIAEFDRCKIDLN
jgi:hypothetical protein